MQLIKGEVLIKRAAQLLRGAALLIKGKAGFLCKGELRVSEIEIADRP